MDIQHINDFLGCPTPADWLEAAADPDNLPTLLRDHAACELKAAQSAQGLIWKYTPLYREPSGGDPSGGDPSARHGQDDVEATVGQAHTDLRYAMSRLAREELRHFEQVLGLMAQRDIAYLNVSPSRYAAGLRRLLDSHEPARLVDTLIVGAFIEARSCERFAGLAPLLDDQLGKFYTSLLKSEARHYQDYLRLAEQFGREPIDERVAHFRQKEVELIGSPDSEFRFHSGVPG